MKRVTLLILISAAAAFLAGCPAPPAGNTNTSNAGNASNGAGTKPAAAAPTKEALVALETKAFEAWKNKDGKFFEGFLTDNFVEFGEKGREGKAETIKGITESKCEVKSIALSDEQMTSVGADVAVLTSKANAEGTCNGQKLVPMWAATIFVRSGDAWKAAYHNEQPVADPKAPPAPPAKADDKKAAPAAETKPLDATTEAMLAVEKKGWGIWQSRDQKGIDDVVSKNMVLIEMGQRFDYAGAMKNWFGPKCEVKGFSLTNAAGVSLAKDAGLLTFKGTPDGKCEGQALTAQWGTTVYVKEGDAWKGIVFFNTPG